MFLQREQQTRGDTAGGQRRRGRGGLLLGAAEQLLPGAVTDHLAALSFPEVILQTARDLPEVLGALGDVGAAQVSQGPPGAGGMPGRGGGDAQEGAQQNQRRHHPHFCDGSCSRALKREEVGDTGSAAERGAFPSLPAIFFPVSFRRFEPECRRVFSPEEVK